MWFWLFADDVAGGARPTPQPLDPETAEVLVEEEEDDDEVTVAAEVSGVLSAMLPWMTSLLFHLGIIVLAMFLVWSILLGEPEEEPIIPIAKLSKNPGGSLMETKSMDLQNTQNVREVVSESTSQEDTLNNLKSNADTSLELVGRSGGGGGGKLAPFGTTAGSGSGIGADFYGTGGNARKIIYVVDASGSLIEMMPFVITELKRSIRELSEGQQFNIIFFQNGHAEEVPIPRKGWKSADEVTKQAVNQYISLEAGKVTPRGATSPVEAITLAMRYRPELVFLLSDNITGRGIYEVDRADLLGMIDGTNKDRKTKINCIQFIHPDSLKTLEAIAKTHGGIYKFIKKTDLGLE